MNFDLNLLGIYPSPFAHIGRFDYALHRNHVATGLLKFTITVPVFANRSQLNGVLKDPIVFSRDAILCVCVRGHLCHSQMAK